MIITAKEETLRIDHLVVTASSLNTGVAYVEQELGVSLQDGGQHPRMGTHNKLLKLGENLYLEVIAPDPRLQAPERPRWFALDSLVADSPPKLATWVAQTQHLEQALMHSPLDHGVIEPMSRGDLHWQITIPSDGELVLDGAAPGLIQWQQTHPANNLENAGCHLRRLEVFSPWGARLDDFLEKLHFEGCLLVHRLPAEEQGYLLAHIETPQGLRSLGGQ